MARRRSASLASVWLQSAQLAAAVPQVVAHRVSRMALAGAVPSARDRKEFDLMSSEKLAAATASWQAMAAATLRSNQAMAHAMTSFWWAAAAGRAPSLAAPMRQSALGALAVLGSGLAPVRRTAVANAKRLRRTPMR